MLFCVVILYKDRAKKGDQFLFFNHSSIYIYIYRWPKNKQKIKADRLFAHNLYRKILLHIFISLTYQLIHDNYNQLSYLTSEQYTKIHMYCLINAYFVYVFFIFLNQKRIFLCNGREKNICLVEGNIFKLFFIQLRFWSRLEIHISGWLYYDVCRSLLHI